MDLNELFPAWRFTPVRDKRPYLPGWQDIPLLYRDIKFPADGYGLILGRHSGGVMALDFDGEEAWAFYAGHFGPNITNTLMWTSGKPGGRMQAAYWVPERHWDDLHTIRVGTNKKLELRWTGSQSVIPPSAHPETGCYSWVDSPTTAADVSELPDQLLAFWLDQCRRESIRPPIATVVPPEPLSITEEKINRLLEVIRQHVGRPGYETWLRLSYATAKAIGVENAKRVMAGNFPEEKAGEYRRLFGRYDPSASPGIGTIIYEARQYGECQFLDDYKVSVIAHRVGGRPIMRQRICRR